MTQPQGTPVIIPNCYPAHAATTTVAVNQYYEYPYSTIPPSTIITSHQMSDQEKDEVEIMYLCTPMTELQLATIFGRSHKTIKKMLRPRMDALTAKGLTLKNTFKLKRETREYYKLYELVRRHVTTYGANASDLSEVLGIHTKLAENLISQHILRWYRETPYLYRDLSWAPDVNPEETLDIIYGGV